MRNKAGRPALQLREAKYVIEEMQVAVLAPDVAVLVGRYHFTAADLALSASLVQFVVLETVLLAELQAPELGKDA
jgi:hypothetical protein